jgi:hypothetical protein
MLIGLLVLAGVPLAALIAINAFDESLTPEAARYGEPRPPAVPEPENGYYALLAIAAGDGEDGAAYAKAWVAEARSAAQENRMELRLEVKRAQRPVVCDAAQTSCVAAAAAKPAETASQLEAYREDLERYEKLIALRRYEEVLDYPLRVVTQFPPYRPVMGAHQAYVLRAALAAASGDLEGAVAAIERDIAFQRVMLSGARTVLGKAVASANYWRDLAFVADLLESRAAALAPLHARLQEGLKPIDRAALQVSSAIEIEFAFAKRFLKNPVTAEPGHRVAASAEQFIYQLFYKPNATINREVGRFLAMAAATSMPVNQGSAELTRILQREAKMGLWEYFDNPAGNLLRRIAMPEDGADAYGRLRLHDLDGYNRLLGLRVEMMASGATADAAGAFVAKSDARFHDPYTGKAMTWDASARRLGFQARSKSIVNRKLFNGEKGWIYLQP